MKGGRPRLAFVSPQFLFPNDTGGKIRTSNILRGLRGGAFELSLIGPATAAQQARWSESLSELCDHFVAWEPAPARPRWRRAVDLLADLPVNVEADRTRQGIDAVRSALAGGGFDAVVFDFVHAAVLRPSDLAMPTLCFTHNVEAEIFERHAAQAGNAVMRRIWASQTEKMRRFEADALRRFDTVIAVSARDAEQFGAHYGLPPAAVIPTGVDLDYFGWQAPPAVTAEQPPTAIFVGSMDWAANVDGVGYFLQQVWPRVLAELPAARFVVVGRQPPAALVDQAASMPGVRFTGFVDDVRPHVHAAHAFVIPLRIGGGTRIKAFQAMAMGCPVVSSAVGMEGLDVTPGEHFLCSDDPAGQAEAVLGLLRDAGQRQQLAQRARRCVEDRFGHRVAAQVFERICLDSLRRA